jgi:kynureninase
MSTILHDTATADPLLRFRDRFPILSNSTYLVSNSLGAMPASTADRLGEYAEIWNRLGVKAWAERWWQLPIEVGNIVAPLMGAAPGTVSMVPTVSQAQAMIVSALTYTPDRDEIIMTALDFPSVRYVTDELAPKLGARVTVVPSDDNLGIDVQRVVDAITPRTKLVAISHVLFKSAYIMEVAPIVAKAKSVGALVLLDAYHAVGVIPVDVSTLGADFYMGGVLKLPVGLARAIGGAAPGADRVAGAPAAVRVRAGAGAGVGGVALAGRHAHRARAVRRHGRADDHR